MRLSWNLGKVAGIDLYLHPSALIFFFIAYSAGASFPEAIALVVALLGSIVMHELGHALMARAYGIRTVDITLYLIGGVARLERMPKASGPELLIALAGPAVSFGLALASWGLSVAVGLAGLRSPEIVGYVTGLNLMLGLFNLLPVFPMDGGRVLRALLSRPLGRVRATEVAVMLGRALAIVGGLYFLSQEMYQSLFLAVFIYVAGSMELRQVQGEGRRSNAMGGLVDVPPPPVGFHWVDRGDGVWRLAPIMAQFGGRDRSWN